MEDGVDTLFIELEVCLLPKLLLIVNMVDEDNDEVVEDVDAPVEVREVRLL